MTLRMGDEVRDTTGDTTRDTGTIISISDNGDYRHMLVGLEANGDSWIVCSCVLVPADEFASWVRGVREDAGIESK